MASFPDADRDGMLHAMRSMMMHRTGIDGAVAPHHRADAGDVRARRRHGLASR